MENVKLHILFFCSLVMFLSSCLDNNDDDSENWNLSNCQIRSFSLKNDSIPGLNNVTFTIDQVNGLIYNRDSMAYGTVIDEEVICNVEYVVGALNVEVYQDATDETAYWNGSDSLDFSSYVRFSVYSIDGTATKNYTARLNIHQQHPDSMTWSRYGESLLGKRVEDQQVILRNGSYWMYVRDNGSYELYQSDNATNWTRSALTGLTDNTFILSQLVDYNGFLYMPTSEGILYHSLNGTDWSVLDGVPEVKALLGVVRESEQLMRPSALAAIISDNGNLYCAAMDKDLSWQTGNVLAAGFPVSGFGCISHEVTFYERLMVVAGKTKDNQLTNTAWETMDGLQWVQLTNNPSDSFDKREGIGLTTYDNHFYLFGGIDASGNAKKDIYRSVNRGLTWEQMDTLIVFPDAFKARGYSSVLVDEDNYILLFGGKENNSAAMFDELWSGRINRLGFND